MKVIRQEKETEVRFETIKSGQMFKLAHEKTIFIKTYTRRDDVDYFDAVDIETGCIRYFNEGQACLILDGFVILT